MSQSYIEKLKDPRWQKKRLQILGRDDFTCQNCFDTKETLHVHHRLYKKGCEPWEYDESYLVTLCATCHGEESADKESCKLLVDTLKLNFFMCDIHNIACAFHFAPFHKANKPPEFIAAALAWAMKDEDNLNQLLDNYTKSFSKPRRST